MDHSRLRLGHVAERIDTLLSDAAKKDVTYLFLDSLLFQPSIDQKLLRELATCAASRGDATPTRGTRRLPR